MCISHKNDEMKQFKFEGRYITLKATAYQNNDTLALMAIYDDDEDDFDILTVNLNNDMLQSDSTAFIDTNNISWAERFLIETGIGEPTGVHQPSGFWTYPLYRISTELLK